MLHMFPASAGMPHRYDGGAIIFAMSEVIEVAPASCPACGADWTVPKSHRPGWGYVPTEGRHGHRTWECAACGHLERPKQVGLRRP